MNKTGFYVNERVFWHSTGVQALFLPLGEWVEPPTGSFGADTPGSKRRLLNLATASGLVLRLAMPSSNPATREDLLRVHPAAYIDLFKKTSDEGGGDLGVFAPFSRGGFEIAQISAGLAVQSVHDVVAGRIRNAYALCRPAGHHCLADKSMGFCLLANIPIALEAARAKHDIGRVAVVDWDVHHGNGTQSIYYDRDDTLTISLHQDRCFPFGYGGEEDKGRGKGLGYNINIPLPAGCGHEAYLYAMEKMVLPALHRFRPELIIVACGLDASAVDPMARMLLHSESYRQMMSMIQTAAADLCQDRVVAIHEGGYSEAYVPFCGHAILESLTGEKPIVADPALDIFIDQQPRASTVKFQCAVIDELAMGASLVC